MTDLKITTDSPETVAIIISILMEVECAEKKHPVWPSCYVKQIAIVAEEAGELVRAGNQLDEGKGTFLEIKEEAIQVAATAIRLLKKLTETEKLYTEPFIIDFLTDDDQLNISQEVSND